jgi:hypothetical protein
MIEDSDPPSDTGAHDDELDEFRALVRAAFEQAQNSGKPDWEEMTSAVLKNRLLDMTERQFSEDRYGSPSFIHLVRRVPDLLDIVGDRPPFRLKIKTPIVVITDTDSASSAEGQTAFVSKPDFATPPEGDWRRVRIRDDLWRAIVDYGSGDIYVLDPDTGYARPKEVTDGDLPVVPTAAQEDISSWRHEFVESLAPAFTTKFAGELEAWLDHGGRQTDLPRPVRGRWVEFLKRKVSNRLNEWFKAQGKPSPSDMLLISETGGLPLAEAIDEVVRTRQLRDLIIRAVRTMTYDELTEISLPAFALLRVSGRTSRKPRQDG